MFLAALTLNSFSVVDLAPQCYFGCSSITYSPNGEVQSFVGDLIWRSRLLLQGHSLFTYAIHIFRQDGCQSGFRVGFFWN